MARHEFVRTTRQEWQEFSDVVQDDVNETLRNLSLEAEATNLKIADLYDDNPEEAKAVAIDAVRYLDSKWDYAGDHFMVVGAWSEPQIAQDSEGIMARHQKKEAFRPSVSDGFAAYSPAVNEPPRVGLSFIVANFPFSAVAMRGDMQLLAYADINDVSIQFMRHGDAKVASSELSEVVNALVRADSTFNLYTNHQNSSFYRQNAKKQETFLRAITESIQEVLPAPDSLERLVIEGAVTPELYMQNPKKPGLAMMRAEQGESPYLVSGHVVGVAVHDLLINGPDRQYLTPDELDSSRTGLSLMVRPDSANFTVDGYEGYFLLPMRKLDSMPLVLESRHRV